ncbi:deoxyribonuclease IV [Tindallia californiensis]|uniref:Probable endonuclease 4 n=1 Tax=Tindallia californiensis TaxID=159292 RepID=A0A1H3J2B1_9FIRM|nr:deoxyribonuclease IV [Tindallia californiensis]SDY33947.1 Endonuclease IV [Tindallia californiensis]
MLTIGCHLSIAKGFYHAGKEALSIGANTFQFFTRNPRGGKAKEIDQEDIEKLKALMKENDFGPLFAHASYTMNLCSNKKETREFSKMIFKDDLRRLNQIPESYYVFHPGSHVGQGAEKGIELIIEAMNESISEDGAATILLEGMSGKGTEIGGRLEELKQIIDGVKYNKKLGICLDSCHLYSAGYDLVKDLDGVLQEVDRVVGLKRLKAFHLNDSKVDFRSHKDRHEKIGNGTLGEKTIVQIVNHPQLKNIPFNLETPNELEGYQQEIELLKKNYKND